MIQQSVKSLKYLFLLAIFLAVPPRFGLVGLVLIIKVIHLFLQLMPLDSGLYISGTREIAGIHFFSCQTFRLLQLRCIFRFLL